jgi:site-specific DNA-methyltransferase (adenine-specific)
VSGASVLAGDLLQTLPGLPDNHFDAVLCDPPYHLTQNSRGGSAGKCSRQPGDGGTTPYGRHRVGTDTSIGKGFMGQTWDGGDIAFRPETWKAVSRVMKPGAYLMAFGGSRTFHRLAVALEDAGFVLVDTLMWLYGSGFPKSHNVSAKMGHSEAQRFAGYGTALKPAYEPILLCRKPGEKTYAENVLEWGCGALNIDGCRIPAENGTPGEGRWPANVMLDEVSAGMLDAQSGIRKSGAMRAGTVRNIGNQYVYGKVNGPATSRDIHASEGGASRFFYVSKVSTRERQAGVGSAESRFRHGTTLRGIENADKEGNDHPTLKPIDLTRQLATLLLPPEREGGGGRRLLAPFAGAGSEMIGALLAGWDEVTGIEQSPRYAELARARIQWWLGTSIASPEMLDFEDCRIRASGHQF